ncbi:MAG: prepilin-type N-terminal cleavage/methylation domain-containing protein [Nitrospira sp.]|nr:prepilin-type N-terminal cleavage/methylation domain-containing protein [Nitrospira sp.]
MTQQGKTLLELIVTLAVLGVLSALAGPNLAHVYAQMQLQTVTTEVASELRLARQLAITRRDRVMVTLVRERESLEVGFLQEPNVHHVYHYGRRGVAIDEPSGGDRVVFYPSGRTATATTIRLRSKEGRTREVTVGFNGRVAVR